MTTPPLKPVRASNVQQVLATQRDLHVRQWELVRASLTLCPGKPPRSLGSPEPPAHQNVLAARLAGVESERAVERQGGRVLRVDV